MSLGISAHHYEDTRCQRPSGSESRPCCCVRRGSLHGAGSGIHRLCVQPSAARCSSLLRLRRDDCHCLDSGDCTTQESSGGGEMIRCWMPNKSVERTAAPRLRFVAASEFGGASCRRLSRSAAVAHFWRSAGPVATTPMMRTRPHQNGAPSTMTSLRVALDSCDSCHSWSRLSGERRTTSHTNDTNGRARPWRTGDGESANYPVEATATRSLALMAGPGALRDVCGRRASPWR